MCGLFGRWDFHKKISTVEPKIESACELLKRRGPDGTDSEYFDSGNGLFFHSRLAISGLNSTGNQPQWTPSGRYLVMFNGEIYNHKALYVNLTTKSYLKNESGDFATLLRLVDDLGVDHSWISAIEGMFAICIFDSMSRALFLCRDRFGQKPLFFSANYDGVTFASDLNIFKELGYQFHLPHEQKIAFKIFGYFPGAFVSYREVQSVTPGTLVKFNFAQHRPETIQLNFQTPSDVEHEQERMELKLSKAAELCLHGDREACLLLSGGVDSSIVAGSLAQNRQVKSYTLGFDEARFDEGAMAFEYAKHLGIELERVQLSSDDIQKFGLLALSICGEPFADSSMIPYLALSRRVSEQYKVAIGGDGGDELAFGYTRHLRANQLRRMISFAEFLSPSVIRRLPWKHKRYLLAANYLSKSTLTKTHSNGLAYILALSNNFSLNLLLAEMDVIDKLIVRLFPPDSAHPADDFRQFDINNYLQKGPLVKVDRASMFFGVEVRSPLLSNSLWRDKRFISRKLNLTNGMGKQSLRKIQSSIFDNLPLNPEKKGFTPPMASWIQGPLREVVMDILFTGDGKYLDSISEKDARSAVGAEALWRQVCLNSFTSAI